MKTRFAFIFIAFLVGSVLPLHALLNVQLDKSVHQPIFAALAFFAVGSVALLGYLVSIKFNFSSITQVKNTSHNVLFAWGFGAFYMAAVIILAPRLGIALTFAQVVTGQLVISLQLGHQGFFGLSIRPMGHQRMLGIVMRFLGVIPIRN